MSERERLEEINNLLERYYAAEDSFDQTDLAISIIQGHTYWLIQQAERVPRLEKDKEFFRRSVVDLRAHERVMEGEITSLSGTVEQLKSTVNTDCQQFVINLRNEHTEIEDRYQQENDRLREALNWIEEEAKADEYGAQERVLKAISETRRALEGESE